MILLVWLNKLLQLRIEKCSRERVAELQLVHIKKANTMLKVCATTATTPSDVLKWQQTVHTKTSPATQNKCVSLAIKSKKSRIKRTSSKKLVKKRKNDGVGRDDEKN